MMSMTVAARRSPVSSETVASSKSRITRGLRQRGPEFEPAVPLFLGDHIGSVLFPTALGLLFAKPAGAGLQAAERLLGVPLSNVQQQRRELDVIRTPRAGPPGCFSG